MAEVVERSVVRMREVRAKKVVLVGVTPMATKKDSKGRPTRLEDGKARKV